MSIHSNPHPLRAPRTPAARAMRVQRIFARMQEGLSYADIADVEGVTRERIRQIVRAATARPEDAPDHGRMQIARLMPALRLAAWDVENGDPKAVATLLKLLDRFDRYFEDGRSFRSLPPTEFARTRRASPGRTPEAGKGAIAPDGASGA